MDAILDTVASSLTELLSSSIKFIPALLTALVILALTRYAAQFVQNLAIQLGQTALRSRSLQLLLAKMSYVAVWVVGVLLAAVLAFPGFNLGDILATLGLSSIAIGFAFQDICENFLAGILLLIQEPFRIDDQIIVGGYEGTVERIDIRTTKIRTYTGERILVPNSTVFTSAVQVRTAFSSRRTDLAVGLDYNTDLTHATELLEAAIASVEGVLENPVPEIDLVSFGDSSIDFIVRYWTAPQHNTVRQTQTKAILAIKATCDREGMSIPYPIRTLYFYNQQKFNDYLPHSGDKVSLASQNPP